MKKKSAMSKLFDYAGNFKYLTMASLVLSVISAWLALVPFYYIWRIIKEILDVAPFYGDAKNLSKYGWTAVGFAIGSMLIYISALMCSHITAFRVQANMRSKVMRHILTLPLGFMDREGSGKVRKIVNESSVATETYLAHQLPDMAGAMATPVGLLVLLIAFDWKLGLLSLIPTALAFLIMGSMTGEKMKEKMKEYQNSLETMSNEAVEYVRGVPVVKTFGQSVFSFKRFKEAIKGYEKWVISYTLDLRMPMTLYTTIINSVFAVLMLAGFVITRNDVTKDFILNFTFYVIITPIITVTLNKIMFSSENNMLVEDALSRIEGITNMKPLEESSAPKPPQDYSVSVNNISFRYDDAKSNALTDINMNIKSGEHIALVGPSGGGKTTLASLIARFWDVNEGEIKIGGVNVKDIAGKELMNTVSFVFQDSKLLKMSIFDNVRLSKPDATREEVLKALKDAQCEDIIAKMPKGIDTLIGSDGTYVSGGEAQRLSIARAMLKDAPILVLDEATAFADPDNEAKVQKAFANLSKGKTVIMIAHRLSTVINADKIYVLKEGRIAEQGTHNELNNKGGIYTHMWSEYNKSVNWKVGVR